MSVMAWRMVATPLDALERRARTLAAAYPVAEARAMEATPGAGSAPGVTIASFGLVLCGDHLTQLRRWPTPIIGRVRDGSTLLDLRSVDPADDSLIAHALAALPTPA